MRVWMLLSVGALLWTQLGTPLASAQHQDRQRRDEVVAMLSGVETIPPAIVWRQRGPGLVSTLRAIFEDRSLPGIVRLRTLAVATALGSDSAIAFLREVLEDASQPPLFLRAALRGVAETRGADALETLAHFLSSEDANLREVCIQALGALDHPRARALLRAHRDIETAPWLVDATERALRGTQRR